MKINNQSLVRTDAELDLMRESGKITAAALKKTLDAALPGISLLKLEEIAESEVLRLGGQPSFKTVPGYFWTTCLTVNDEIVHGLPRDIILKEGDLLNVDLGAIFKGWHTDAAWSKIIGEDNLQKDKIKDKIKFLKVGKDVLSRAIRQAVSGRRVGDISSAIEVGITKERYSVVKSLAGHGVGRDVHEDPEIPEYGKPGTGMELLKSMTLAIEVIYTSGKGDVFEKDDGWTIAAIDGSLGGLFEMTVVVNDNKPEVLTDFRNI